MRQVMQEVLHPGEVGVANRRNTVLPSFVVPEPLAAPVGDVEGRVGQDVVGPQVGVLIVVEAVAVGNLGLDAPDRQVHLRQPPGGVVGVPLRPVVVQGHFPAVPESLVAVLTRPSGSALWG